MKKLIVIMVILGFTGVLTVQAQDNAVKTAPAQEQKKDKGEKGEHKHHHHHHDKDHGKGEKK